MCYYGVFDILYLCDVIIHFIHRYWKSFRQKFQLSCKSRISLYIDIISLLPQEVAIKLIYDRLIYYCRFITYIRMYRVFEFFKQMLGSVTTHRWSLFLAQYFVIFIMFLHTAVCIWYYLGCYQPNCKSYYWTSLLYLGDGQVDNLYDWYMFCAYISISFLSTTGFGDFYAVSTIERIYCILVMICGYLLLILLISMLTVLLINKGYRKAQFFFEVRIYHIDCIISSN